MKIIALLPVKNESWILPVYLSSLAACADMIIAIDDGSTDTTKQLLVEHNVRVYDAGEKPTSGWAEFSIRKRLLELGRQHGGTHFICLDADEAFSCDAIELKQYIQKLLPGQSLRMHWTTLWKTPSVQRIDGIYSTLTKDFIFHDAPNLEYSYAFLGVARTPHSLQSPAPLIMPEEHGSVLHFQYVDHKKATIKQAWYMCSELIKKDRSARRINATYAFTLETSTVKTKELNKQVFACLPISNITYISGIIETFHFKKITEWFDQYGIEFFEPLLIWHIEELKQEFIKRMHRTPVSRTFPPVLLFLNTIKNKIKNAFR